MEDAIKAGHTRDPAAAWKENPGRHGLEAETAEKASAPQRRTQPVDHADRRRYATPIAPLTFTRNCHALWENAQSVN
jgi:hypothetical protein